MGGTLKDNLAAEEILGGGVIVEREVGNNLVVEEKVRGNSAVEKEGLAVAGKR
jgi:hypothetical protein